MYGVSNLITILLVLLVETGTLNTPTQRRYIIKYPSPGGMREGWGRGAAGRGQGGLGPRPEVGWRKWWLGCG